MNSFHNPDLLFCPRIKLVDQGVYLAVDGLNDIIDDFQAPPGIDEGRERTLLEEVTRRIPNPQ
jgi:hypothetical protein